MKNKLLLILFLITASASVFAQTIVVDSVFESRCAASGRAYFSEVASSTGTWKIISNPTTYSPDPFGQSIGTYFALPAGNYEVQFENGAGLKDTAAFVIVGNYLDPIFAVDTIIDAVCPGQGEIHLSMTLGNDPYRFRLLHRDSAPGNFQAWTNSPIFDSLRAGSYTVEAEDSCGVLLTIGGLVVDYPNGGPIGYSSNGTGGIYHSDEVTSFPTSCSETTLAMMFRRNMYFQSQNASLMIDGDGNNVADQLDPNQVPLHLQGGLPPYTYTLAESQKPILFYLQ